MSAHSAGGGSPSVRQLIARYQSIDSSSSSPRPTVPSPRPAETRSPRHARRGFASQEHERAHKSENRPLLEAINDVFYGSDGSRTSGVAQMPPSPSYPDTIASSVSEEDISTGFPLSRDKNSPVTDRNTLQVSMKRRDVIRSQRTCDFRPSDEYVVAWRLVRPRTRPRKYRITHPLSPSDRPSDSSVDQSYHYM
jgi:hypothetical protein